MKADVVGARLLHAGPVSKLEALDLKIRVSETKVLRVLVKGAENVVQIYEETSVVSTQRRRKK